MSDVAFFLAATFAAGLLISLLRLPALLGFLVAGFVLDAFARSAPPEPSAPVDDPEVDSLTPREKEVLRLLARGYTYREIAEELFISVKTVETHASNVLRKTQQSNRHALSRWARTRHLD